MLVDSSSEDDNAEDLDFSSLERSSSGSTNEDLRELCHLLNEERAKMFELTELWKTTSTSTIHKLEEQISTYQKKLMELEQRQIHLIEENRSLKDQLQHQQESTRKTEKKSKSKSKDKQKKTLKSPPLSSREFQVPSHHQPIPKQAPVTVDSLEQQASIQRMFDAIKTAEVYESLGDFNESERVLLRDFCHLIWKYLQERSKPKSSCLL